MGSNAHRRRRQSMWRTLWRRNYWKGRDWTGSRTPWANAWKVAQAQTNENRLRFTLRPLDRD